MGIACITVSAEVYTLASLRLEGGMRNGRFARRPHDWPGREGLAGTLYQLLLGNLKHIQHDCQ